MPLSNATPVRIVPPPVPPQPVLPLAARCVARLAAADRLLLTALTDAPRSPGAWRAWRAVTHLGGAIATTAACAAPLLAGGAARRAGVYVTLVVLLAQLLVHLVKRLVGRPRPACGAGVLARAVEPDRFSFPSGHAAAAMAVALGYAAAWPALAPALLLLALVVGVSRAVLGVHYLGDVAAGAALAGASAAAVRAALPYAPVDVAGALAW